MSTTEDRMKDIKENPERHKHDFDGLIACCTMDGVLDTRLMDAHEGLAAGHGSRCDVSRGPCACGAWH